MLFQVIGERFAYSLVYGSHNLVVAELRFGLSFKLRFGHLDGDNRGQTFAEVVTEISTFAFSSILLSSAYFFNVRVSARRKPAK